MSIASIAPEAIRLPVKPNPAEPEPGNHIQTSGTQRSNPLLPSLEPSRSSGRLDAFGTTANTGTAADSHDFDGDGLANGIEFVIGSNPASFTDPSTPGYRSQEVPASQDPDAIHTMNPDSEVDSG